MVECPRGGSKLCFSHYYRYYPRQEGRTSARCLGDRKAVTPSIMTSIENAGAGTCRSSWGWIQRRVFLCTLYKLELWRLRGQKWVTENKPTSGEGSVFCCCSLCQGWEWQVRKAMLSLWWLLCPKLCMPGNSSSKTLANSWVRHTETI